MEAVCWYESPTEGWIKVNASLKDDFMSLFEVDEDGELGIPVDIQGLGSNFVKFTGATKFMLRQTKSAKARSDQPEPFGFTVLTDQVSVAFCVQSKELLFAFRTHIKGVTEQSLARPQEISFSDSELGLGTSSEEHKLSDSGSSSTVSGNGISEEGELPDVEAGASGVHVAPVRTTTIVIVYGNLDFEVTFTELEDLKNISVLHLKEILCKKWNSRGSSILRPVQVDLYIGNVALREHWVGKQVALLDGSVLKAVKSKIEHEMSVPSSDYMKAPITTLDIRIPGGRIVPVTVHEGDNPLHIGDLIQKRYQLEPKYASSIAFQVYKCVNETLLDRNKSLKTKVAELKHRLHEPGNPREPSTYEGLFEQAAERVTALEKENKELGDKVFELRLLNAERYS
mmetsp:Transcript_9229/g.14978  ORF Transcript_9229/g.14978 Transcript_9229/m.14978 type:complete len:398 (+) Transcript_9229:460-1653(+)